MHFGLSANHESGLDLSRDKAAVDDVLVKLHALDVGEHKLRVRWGKLPFLERVGHEFAEGNNALARKRLGLADHLEPVA